MWIPLQALVLTYQGQLVKRRLEFQASQVISVGVAASAMPDSEGDALEGVAIPDSLPEASSSNSSSTTAAASIPAEGVSNNSASSLAGAAAQVVDSSSFPEHERFSLLIRSIRAEVEL